MKAKTMTVFYRAMLSNRYIIKTINKQLKSISQVEHSHHRSEAGFMLNVISKIVAYGLKKQKPRIKLPASELRMMTV